MGFSTFSGPVRVGPIKEGSTRNTGVVVLSQTDTFAYTDTGAFATNIILPAGSQILNMFVDASAAWNTGTSDALEIGTQADPDAYADVADLQGTGRLALTMPDAGQATACANIGTSDVTVYLKITSSGTAASAGAAYFTVVYAQKDSAGNANPTSV